MAQRRSIVPIIVAALVGVALIVGVRLALSGGGEDAGSQAADSGSEQAPAPEDCQELTVVSSSEKAGLLSQLADSFNQERREAAGTCVSVRVVAKASGLAATALARGWDVAVDGPRPDVWTPASSSWTGVTAYTATGLDRPNVVPATGPSVAQTPLVVAMPRPMAEALGWPDKAVGWADLSALARSPEGWGAQGHPEWGRFRLGKTNPTVSTSGLNATLASYFAATGVSSDLTVAQVKDKDTRAFVSAIESAVVHYGDTTLSFLENMSREAAAGRGMSYVSAVTVEEKSVLDYNQGNPSGDPATQGRGPAPEIPLVAVYPSEGTLVSDNPWLTIDADWVTEADQAIASVFLEWLRQPEQQSVFTNAGFRTFEGEPGGAITAANGLIAGQPTAILDPPAPAVIAAVESSWDQLRKRAHVLLVMDVSGSMSAFVSSAGQTKMALAQDAAVAALDGFAGDDEAGLWAFSTDRGPGGEPWVELQPVAPAADSVPVMRQRIAGLVAEGGTALYATLRQAQKDVLAELDTSRINAIIVLSDGKNEYPPDDDLASLESALHGESVDTSVRVFTIGYGEGADPAALQAIAEASRGAYYDATDPASVEQVLTSVLSNF